MCRFRRSVLAIATMGVVAGTAVGACSSSPRAASVAATVTAGAGTAPASSAPPGIGSTTGSAGTSTTTGSATTTTSAAPAASTQPATTPATSTTPAAVTTTAPPQLLAGLATDATGLGRQLSAALRTIVDPGAPAEAVETAGRRQQLVIRRLAAHQDWQPDALAAVDPDLRDIAGNDLAAINAPGNVALAKPVPPKDTIPAWRIRAPLPVADLLAAYQDASAETGIEWVYLAAINLVETRMGRIVGLSGDGAVGPMQFLPATWAVCCTGDPTVDHDAIVGAAHYLVRRGGPADMRRAILGYNPNDAYLEMIERYAGNLRAHPALYAGYHAWQVFVATTSGPIRLPVGFESPEPLDAAGYLATHPDDRA